MFHLQKRITCMKKLLISIFFYYKDILLSLNNFSFANSPLIRQYFEKLWDRRTKSMNWKYKIINKNKINNFHSDINPYLHNQTALFKSNQFQNTSDRNIRAQTKKYPYISPECGNDINSTNKSRINFLPAWSGSKSLPPPSGGGRRGAGWGEGGYLVTPR